MIDKSFLEEMQSLATRANTTEVLTVHHVPCEPADVCHIREPGKPLRRIVGESLRNYRALRVKDLGDLVEDRCKVGDFKRIYVFCGLGRATAIFGEDERRHIAYFQAAPCLQFEAVRACPTRKLTPVEFVKMLRIELAGCVPEEFLAWARQLKFAARTESDSDIQVGRESMGRKIENQVSGIAAVPETVWLEVPTHDDLVDADGVLVRFGVECAVDLDYAAGTLRLVPLAGELTAALRSADEWICTQLKGLEALSSTTVVKVFCGV